MADNYMHQHSARKALEITGYVPRNIDAFVMGANGPDPLFCYQMYNPFRKLHLSKLGSLMHKERTGRFLRNMFESARTDAQKDYCLGFLCHYSMDSVIHPYVEYVDSAYGSPFNIPSGHGWFESAVDSRTALADEGNPAATYEGHSYTQEDYIQAFKDFRMVKKFFYSPHKTKRVLAKIIEKVLGFEEGYVVSHMQPCSRQIPEFPFWQDEASGLYSAESLDDILLRADRLSAEALGYGLDFFAGKISSRELIEKVGNKSYETGMAIPDSIFEEKEKTEEAP